MYIYSVAIGQIIVREYAVRRPKSTEAAADGHAQALLLCRLFLLPAAIGATGARSDVRASSSLLVVAISGNRVADKAAATAIGNDQRVTRKTFR